MFNVRKISLLIVPIIAMFAYFVPSASSAAATSGVSVTHTAARVNASRAASGPKFFAYGDSKLYGSIQGPVRTSGTSVACNSGQPSDPCQSVGWVFGGYYLHTSSGYVLHCTFGACPIVHTTALVRHSCNLSQDHWKGGVGRHPITIQAFAWIQWTTDPCDQGAQVSVTCYNFNTGEHQTNISGAVREANKYAEADCQVSWQPLAAFYRLTDSNENWRPWQTLHGSPWH